MPKLDWRKHPMRFRCFCDVCKSQYRGDMRLWSGKRWERMYGEPQTAFRKRYLNGHKGATLRAECN